MKWTTLLTLFLALPVTASQATTHTFEVAYDENSSSLVAVQELGTEPQLTATHEDLSRAHIVAVINKSPMGSTTQTMRVYVDGTLMYEWKVSTGREKQEVAKSGRAYLTTTPVGYFRPTKLEVNHYSQTWKADMPHAVFFNGGIAAHATTHIEQLGKRASGGCVRLAPENAKAFFDLVNAEAVKSVQKINRAGQNVVDTKGNPVLVPARDVLIIVENHA